MKALVLSGGAGTRLRPFSYSMPKQLIPIANKPVLEHVLENVRAVGVTDVGVVVGDRADEIAQVIGDGSRLGLRITLIPQEKPLGLAHCVALARPFLGDDDFVMYLGDNMLPGGIAGIAADFAAHRPDAEVVVHKVRDPRAFGVAELAPDGSVLRLVEKPEHPRSDLALIGVYFFTPAVHDAVAAIAPGARGELEITDAIQWLVTHGSRVTASEYDGYWKDTGQADDVLACNRAMLGEQTTRIDGEVDAASVVAGRVVIEAGARLVGSTVAGPAVIGSGTVIANSTVGPHTSIGRDCVLRDTTLTDSIVMDGASITAVTGLRSSLIGRNAVVGAGAEGDGHRLVIGDHTHIEVAA